MRYIQVEVILGQSPQEMNTLIGRAKGYWEALGYSLVSDAPDDDGVEVVTMNTWRGSAKAPKNVFGDTFQYIHAPNTAVLVFALT